MSTNQSEFARKFKKMCQNRAVIVTAITLLAALSVVIAVTVSANRAKRPSDSTDTSVIETDTQSKPSGGDVTLPVYNNQGTQPTGDVNAEPEDTPFALPVEGKLFKSHDATLQVYSATMGDYRVHLGLDIATAAEAPVYAAADGKIERIWDDAMMGTCVAISHEGEIISIYKNLSKTLADGIEAGATVKSGDCIGRVGDTAVMEMADEPHLHYEMTLKGLAVDPLDYFSRESVDALSKDTAHESSAVTEPSTVNGK